MAPWTAPYLPVLLASAMAARASEGPCDIFSKGGTPCVAAHSTVRALLGSYDGALYRVKRASDGTTVDVKVSERGGIADAASQDRFCDKTDCIIDMIYDQTSYGNDLALAPPGGAAPHADAGVNASRAPLIAGGAKVYAAYFEGGMGYRRENTSGVATADEPETMYMVTAGDHYNGGCCFDYGNAEIDAKDHGAGTMEAVYFGNSSGWGRGGGDGPWVMADLENGLWAGAEKINPDNTRVEGKYITAMVKGRSGGFALKGGNAQTGELKTLFEGGRPKGYEVMKKQGAIILGIGGDNSDWAIGTFYEGCMTKGYSSDETDAAVQANIVAVGYGK